MKKRKQEGKEKKMLAIHALVKTTHRCPFHPSIRSPSLPPLPFCPCKPQEPTGSLRTLTSSFNTLSGWPNPNHCFNCCLFWSFQKTEKGCRTLSAILATSQLLNKWQPNLEVHKGRPPVQLHSESLFTLQAPPSKQNQEQAKSSRTDAFSVLAALLPL